MGGMFNKGGSGLTGKSSKAGVKGAAKRPPRKGTTAPPIEAMQLLGKWTRVAQGHIAYGASCNCCTADFGNLQAKDMEQHILDYIDSKYRAAGSTAVCDLLAQHAGYRHAESGSIAELLRAIATASGKSVRNEDQLSMLADIGRSIDSLDEAMNSGAA
jgi:hypothetical protein